MVQELYYSCENSRFSFYIHINAMQLDTNCRIFIMFPFLLGFDYAFHVSLTNPIFCLCCRIQVCETTSFTIRALNYRTSCARFWCRRWAETSKSSRRQSQAYGQLGMTPSKSCIVLRSVAYVNKFFSRNKSFAEAITAVNNVRSWKVVS